MKILFHLINMLLPSVPNGSYIVWQPPDIHVYSAYYPNGTILVFIRHHFKNIVYNYWLVCVGVQAVPMQGRATQVSGSTDGAGMHESIHTSAQECQQSGKHLLIFSYDIYVGNIVVHLTQQHSLSTKYLSSLVGWLLLCTFLEQQQLPQMIDHESNGL